MRASVVMRSKWSDQQSSGLSKAHVPLEFDPGEADQFDWSHAA